MKNGTIYEVQIHIAAPQKLPWQDGALCTQIGFQPFFPDTGVQYTEARKICGSCDVREECLAWIMKVEDDSDVHNRHGMFAGLNPRERYALYLEQRNAEKAA
jgi:hypothetical protein